jgi:hypothetical protein
VTFVFRLFAASTLALAVSASGQKPAVPAGYHMDKTHATEEEAELRTECQAMMDGMKKMQDEHQAMDAALDKLVAQMNLVQQTGRADAIERPMAAVVNELAAQSKASRSMMMEMQPQMMLHMVRYTQKQADRDGDMECPIMKMGTN